MMLLLLLLGQQVRAIEPDTEVQSQLSIVSATRAGKTRGWSSIVIFGQAGETWALPSCDAAWATPAVEQIAGRPALSISAAKGTPLPATVRCASASHHLEWTLVSQPRR